MAKNANSAKVMAWQKANPEAYLAKSRAWRLKTVFGLTVEQYDQMVVDQDGVCACCRNPDYAKRLAVDHDHKTGKVRGLLCHTCNNHLGIYEAKKEAFDDYLKRYP